jgi:hypothetical protein
MFTEMAPATAAAAIGGELTVDSTFACELAAPGRSAEPAMAMTHDRCNHNMGSDPGAQGWWCERRRRQFAALRRSSTVKFANRSTSFSGVASSLQGISRLR